MPSNTFLNPEPQDGHRAFSSAGIRFAGRITPVRSNTVLHTTMSLRHAKAVVASALHLADPDTAWSAFWHPSVTSAERLDALKDITLLDPPSSPSSKSMVWVYFDPIIARTGGSGNPLSGKSTDARCNDLGLPTSWFPIGKPVVGLSYLLKAGTTLGRTPSGDFECNRASASHRGRRAASNPRSERPAILSPVGGLTALLHDS